VPKVWRSSWKVISRTWARPIAFLEPPRELGAVERVSRLGMAEHKILVGGIGRATAQLLELLRDEAQCGPRHPAAPSGDRRGEPNDLSRPR
jgi:hypothetical protein